MIHMAMEIPKPESYQTMPAQSRMDGAPEPQPLTKLFNKGRRGALDQKQIRTVKDVDMRNVRRTGAFNTGGVGNSEEG